MNFLKDTLRAIQQFEHTVDDIIFIGSLLSGHSCEWEEFVELVKDVEIDDSWRSNTAVIPEDLIIAFVNNGYMRRTEYDSEWTWTYVEPFRQPEKRLPIHTLVDPERQAALIRILNQEPQ